MGGHNAAESVDSFQRNQWSQCGGIRKSTKLRTKTTAKTKPVKKATKKTTPKKSAPTSKGSVSITDTAYIPHPKITIFDYFLFLLKQAVGTV